MQARKSSYHFGPYRLDVSQRVLLRDGKPVSLTLKAFDTLIALVQKQGVVVEKDDLMKQVWPDARRGFKSDTEHLHPEKSSW